MENLYFPSQKHRNFFDLHPPSSFDVWRAVGQEAFLDNPEQLAVRLYGHTKERYFNTDKISEEAFKTLFPNAAQARLFEWNPHMTVEEAEVLHIRKTQEAANQYIAAKGRGGLVEAVGCFGTAILTSFASPTNIAMSFIPIGGQARWAAIIAKAGALRGGMLKGAVSNAVFQAGITPLVAANRYFEQSPYGVKEAGFDIAVAGAFGAGVHALGYGASKLKNRFFVTPETLRPEWDSPNPKMREGFKDNVRHVAGEDHFEPEIVDWENLSSDIRNALTPENSLDDLRRWQEKLFEEAYRHPNLRPLLEQEMAAAHLEGSLHETYKTGGDECLIPDEALAQLEEARGRLASLQEALGQDPLSQNPLGNNPEWTGYQNAVEEIDKLIRNQIREHQYQGKAYDLSVDKLYVAKAQINEGKHIDLDNPHKAESFYAKDAVVEEKQPKAALEKVAFENIGLEELAERELSLSAIRLEEAHQFVSQHQSPYLGLKNLLRNVELRQKAAAGELRNGFFYDLEQQDLVQIFKNREHHADIARELEALTKPSLKAGFTGNRAAMALAKIIHKWQTIAINRANKAGACIIPLEGYITRQTHSDKAIRKMGMEGWVKFITPLLDHGKTFGEEGVNLPNVFEALVTGKHFTSLEEYTYTPSPSSSNIAAKLAAPRKLHFKSAEDWLTYNEACGLYRLSDSVLLNLERIGESIGLLETLGSTPALTFKNLQERLAEELRPKAAVDNAAQTEMKRVERERLNGMLEWLMGHNTPENPKAASACQAIRNWKSMASLGKAVLSSFPDMANWAVELQNNGVPLLKSYGNILNALTYSLNSTERKSLARKLGIACDNLLGFAYSRLNADSPIPGAMTKATNAFFKANCLEWWDRSFKHTMGMVLSNHLAESSLKEFHALPKALKDKLSYYGVTGKEWGVLRHAVETVEGNPYLIPDNTLSIRDSHFAKAGISVGAIEQTKESLGNAIRCYLLDRVNTGIATPGQIERYLMYFGTRPGTPEGEFWRFFLQFKTFPLTFVMRPLKSVTVDRLPIGERTGNYKDVIRALQHPTTLGLMGQLLMGTTVLGYVGMCATKMLKGESIPDPEDGKVWKAAFLKGGGLGLFGDFLFQEYSRYGRNFMTEMAGPMVGVTADVLALYSDAKDGRWDKVKQESLRLLKRNTPCQNLFYLEPALAGVGQ